MVETWQQIILSVIAIGMGVAALRVVTSRNVVHAALYLVGTLLGAAAMYVLLFAEFVAWVQVLVYVGAVVVLMLFGLMLTRAPIGNGNFDNDQKWVAALCSAALFGVTTWILLDAFEGQKINFGGQRPQVSGIGEAIFSDFVLPFEVVSVLLLAALIGAVVIARKDDN